MPCLRANAGTPPMWSECSCVTRIAASVSGATPSRARRVVVSRTPKPQSIRTLVRPACTTSPLPSLPLPSEAKRTPLLQLILEEPKDLPAVRALVGRTVRVLDADEGPRVRLHHEDPVLLRLFGRVLPEHELRQPALVGLLQFRIRVADE